MPKGRRRYNKIIKEWGNRCIICGEPIKRPSITREHIIPRSMLVDLDLQGLEHNVGCSHYNCNHFRKTMPIFMAAFLLEEKKKKMGIKKFRTWIDKKVPNRV